MQCCGCLCAVVCSEVYRHYQPWQLKPFRLAKPNLFIYTNFACVVRVGGHYLGESGPGHGEHGGGGREAVPGQLGRVHHQRREPRYPQRQAQPGWHIHMQGINCNIANRESELMVKRTLIQMFG